MKCAHDKAHDKLSFATLKHFAGVLDDALQQAGIKSIAKREKICGALIFQACYFLDNRWVKFGARRYRVGLCFQEFTKDAFAPIKALVADYARLAEIDADNAADYRYRQGAALNSLNDTAGARKAFDAALARDPKQVDALYERALLNFAERKLPAAIADLDKAIALSPRAANARYARGLAWSTQGNMARAIADFDAALKLKPDYPEALLARAPRAQREMSV